jgi:hypothetical protein
MFLIERGQILCPSYDGCRVQVRFDDDKPVYYYASGPADHSSELVFLNQPAKFIERARKAKVARISLNIYDNGSPVFEFPIADFDVSKLKAPH